jgi:predicted nucleic acid-binding protein
LLKLYLDTSVMLKRYVTEPGTDVADEIFDKAETGELTITVSLWNIGEAIGVLDEKRRRKWITEEEFKQTLKNLADELIKLMRLKTLEVIPVHTPILTDTWDTVMTYHIYEADALQISTCKHTKNDALISADETLAKTSKETVRTYHITKDKEQLRQLIQES